MVLNYIFIAFFVIAIAIALIHLILTGDFSVFEAITQSSFVQAKNGFEIALYLTGILCLWLGLLKVAEESGITTKLAKLASPILVRLFPTLPEGHPVFGNIFMNISANMLGLDNAATPLGLKTMQELQVLNEDKKNPSNAMIMFLALNASGLTLIPTSIIAFRMQAGAANPADVFLPILMATSAATLVAIVLVALKQRISLWSKPLILFFLSFIALFAGVIYLSHTLSNESFNRLSTGFSAFLLMNIILVFFVAAVKKKINAYEVFIEGAKEGFSTAVMIIPYLVAMLVSIGVFRASGAMDFIMQGCRYCVGLIGLDTTWVEAIPTILMKPLSGSGARGLMVDAMQTYGADSFVGRLCCTVQGTSDTTFYVIALYLGSVGISRSKYLVGYSLLADLAGAVTAIFCTYLFFA